MKVLKQKVEAAWAPVENRALLQTVSRFFEKYICFAQLTLHDTAIMSHM